MTLRNKLLFAAMLALAPLVAARASTSPSFGLLLAVAVPGMVLAYRSTVYPVALSGVPTLVIALLGRNPFPHGLVTFGFFAWTMLAISFALTGGVARVPIQLLTVGAVAASFLLAFELVLREEASLAPDYAAQKIQLFVLQNLALLVAGLVISQRTGHFELYVRLSVWIAGAAAVLLLWRLTHGQADAVYANRFSISSEENPIQLGRESAGGLMAATYLLLSARRRRTRWIAAALSPVLAISLLAAGSRGPVLGALVGMVTLIALSARSRIARRRLVTVALAGVAAAILAAQLVPGGSLQRSLSFLSGSGSGLSSNGRYVVWSEAWHLFTAHPFAGVGTGSFWAVDGIELYPHNLFLEVGSELGLLGLGLLIWFLASSIFALVRAQRGRWAPERLQVALVAAYLAAALTNAMFSGDLTTNASLWLNSGLALGLSLRAATRPRLVGPPAVDQPAP
jgi:O-antigen ligase